jgi:hypothetical protein
MIPSVFEPLVPLAIGLRLLLAAFTNNLKRPLTISVVLMQDHPGLGKLFITTATIPIVGAILFFVYLVITFAIVGNKLQG